MRPAVVLAASLVVSGCGVREPSAPTAAASPAVELAMTLNVSTPAGTGPGLRSVSVLGRFPEPTGLGGVIENASLQVLTSGDAVLAMVKRMGIVIPPRGYGELREELSWSSADPGARLEVSVTVRDGAGVTRTFTRTVVL